MAALILYRTCDPCRAPCASAGLYSNQPQANQLPSEASRSDGFFTSRNAAVLTLPFYHVQRAGLYGSAVSVRPLRLRWLAMSVDDVRRILGFEAGGAPPPETVAAVNLAVLRLLSSFRAGLPPFAQFASAVRCECALHAADAPAAAAAIESRLDLLEALAAEESVRTTPLPPATRATAAPPAWRWLST